MRMRRRLLVASGNKGKIREIEDFLSDRNGELDNRRERLDRSKEQLNNGSINHSKDELEFEIVGLDQFPEIGEVAEDGDTFIDNALKKARERAQATGLLTLADDSGLAVDCLDGAPGVYSARYAGENASDQENNQKLREALEDIPREQRTASFKCAMALVDPENNEEIVVEGSCEGIIELEPRGENGFGYDPYFFLPGYGKTMAELPLKVKNQISHRARALVKIKEEINERYR
jgi:XTP/dITP diphosphohydrolase